MAKFISGKIDQIIFDDINLVNIFKLYIAESGGIITEKDNYFIAKR